MVIYNQPHFIPVRDYHKELEKYLNRVCNIPGLVGVMTMGSIEAPGLSDLDLICIIDDSFPRNKIRYLSTATEYFRHDIFIHGPVIIPYNIFSSLYYIIYVSRLSNVYGSKLSESIHNCEGEEKVNLALSYLIDFSESRLVQYAAARESGFLDKRAWMTRLWSLVHTEKLSRIANLSLSKTSLKIIEEIRDIRESWKTGKCCDDNCFKDLFERSEAVIQEAFSLACDKAYSKMGYPVLKKDALVYRTSNKQIFCLHRVDSPFSIAKPLCVLGRKRLFINTYTPIKHAAHLQAYGFLNTSSAHIECRENTYVKTMQKRARLVDEHVRFLVRKNIDFSMSGYLGLPVRTKNLAISLIDFFFWKLFAFRTGNCTK